MTRLLLARHGQSEWNAAGRWQGHADPGLSELGRRQARAAAEVIGMVDAVVASDLERARQTAEIIAEALGVGPVEIEPLFKERDVGEWSGLTRVEIEERWPGWIDDPARRRPNGWESDEHVLERALLAMASVATRYPGADVLVVTHGGLISALERLHLGLERQPTANLAARWVEVDGERIVAGDRLILVDAHDAAVTVPQQQ
jgi:probable phosphoglycerate mutase